MLRDLSRIQRQEDQQSAVDVAKQLQAKASEYEANMRTAIGEYDKRNKREWQTANRWIAMAQDARAAVVAMRFVRSPYNFAPARAQVATIIAEIKRYSRGDFTFAWEGWDDDEF